MEVPTPSARKTSTCPDATFTSPDLTVTRLAEFGLIVVGQRGSSQTTV